MRPWENETWSRPYPCWSPNTRNLVGAKTATRPEKDDLPHHRNSPALNGDMPSTVQMYLGDEPPVLRFLGSRAPLSPTCATALGEKTSPNTAKSLHFLRIYSYPENLLTWCCRIFLM
ncbi:unnamed protein product [Larinioides sclopetarius]|uniref:Uncharacterized protein n=1 Tax=Larinioides sclopetarius TaxID=280406 RepID=A0AAV2B7J6_9ARAC